jgi:DNA-directed RNA polymerase subunit M/transcription elongation factor TFIIS
MPPGQHVLRVARAGEVDDERVIEIRPDGIEQIIQAQFRQAPTSEPLSPSRGGSLDSRTGAPSAVPRVVACTSCGSRFAEGIKFCGRCGSATFMFVKDEEGIVTGSASHAPVPPAVACPRCQREYPFGIRFCGKCGIPIGTQSLEWNKPRPVEVICKTCGSSYSGSTKFCGRCGQSISS